MGEPVQIVELARRMIRLKGLQPDVDINIEFSGLRPGEKLSERVFYPEEAVIETAADGVLEAHTDYPPLHELSPKLDMLIEAAHRRDRAHALDILSNVLQNDKFDSNVFSCITLISIGNFETVVARQEQFVYVHL